MAKLNNIVNVKINLEPPPRKVCAKCHGEVVSCAGSGTEVYVCQSCNWYHFKEGLVDRPPDPPKCISPTEVKDMNREQLEWLAELTRIPKEVIGPPEGETSEVTTWTDKLDFEPFTEAELMEAFRDWNGMTDVLEISLPQYNAMRDCLPAGLSIKRNCMLDDNTAMLVKPDSRRKWSRHDLNIGSDGNFVLNSGSPPALKWDSATPERVLADVQRTYDDMIAKGYLTEPKTHDRIFNMPISISCTISNPDTKYDEKTYAAAFEFENGDVVEIPPPTGDDWKSEEKEVYDWPVEYLSDMAAFQDPTEFWFALHCRENCEVDHLAGKMMLKEHSGRLSSGSVRVLWTQEWTRPICFTAEECEPAKDPLFEGGWPLRHCGGPVKVSD